MGIVICVLSLLLLIKAKYERSDEIEHVFWSASAGQKKAIYILLALFACGLLLEKLGYVLTVFLFLGFLLRSVDPQKWLVVLGGALLGSAGSYILFKLCLKVQLPLGFLGI
jgi:hypothetical protein